MSICVNAVLFTIKDKNPKENKYIPIFYMWLGQLIKEGGLTEKDMIYLYVDTETLHYMDADGVFSLLQTKLPFEMKLFVYPPPLTLFDGTMMRFEYHEYTQDIWMYCDIDILVLKSLHVLTEHLTPNTIAIHPEGLLKAEDGTANCDYGSAFSKEDLVHLSPTAMGLSNGKFMIRGNEIHQTLIHIIRTIHRLENAPFFMFDQCYFNKAIYLMMDQQLCLANVTIFQSPILSTNGHGFTDQTVLLDAMGIPGDGDFHLNKIIKFYTMINTGVIYNLSNT
jgi:hypothetical protein